MKFFVKIWLCLMVFGLNAQTNLGKLTTIEKFTPDQLSGLYAWWEANDLTNQPIGSIVTNWTDRVSGKSLYRKTTGSNQSLQYGMNSNKAVYSSSQYWTLSHTNEIGLGTNWTLFYLANTGIKLTAQNGSVPYNGTGPFTRSYQVRGGNLASVLAVDGNSSIKFYNCIAISDTSNKTIVAENNAIRFNGANNGSFTTITNLEVGRNATASSYNGYCYAIIIYTNFIQNTADIKKVQKYLCDRYSLPLFASPF